MVMVIPGTGPSNSGLILKRGGGFKSWCFFFIPTWGEMIQFDEYFSDGLKTHQPEKRCHKSSSQS